MLSYSLIYLLSLLNIIGIISSFDSIKFKSYETIVTYNITKINITKIVISQKNDIFLCGAKTFNNLQQDSTIVLYFRSSDKGKWYQTEIKQQKGIFLSSIYGLFDKKDKLHLFYGNRTFALNNTLPFFNRIQYSKCENETWKIPESIFELKTHNVNFGVSSIKTFLDEFNIPVILFVCKTDTNSNPKLNFAKLDNNKSQKLFSIAENIADFDAISDRSGNYHVAFLSGAEGKGPDINSVFYLGLNKHGDIIFKNKLIHKSGLFSVDNIKILMGTDSTKHIIFTKNLNKKFCSNGVYHCFSKCGLDWTDSVKINKGFAGDNFNPTAVIDSKNNIHLFWEWSENIFKNPPNILYSKYDGENWSIPILIFKNASSPIVTIDNDDYIHIVFVDLAQKEKKIYSLNYTKTIAPVVLK